MINIYRKKTTHVYICMYVHMYVFLRPGIQSINSGKILFHHKNVNAHAQKKKSRVFTEEVFLVYFPMVVYTAMECIFKIHIVMSQNFEYMLNKPIKITTVISILLDQKILI